jgi:feruloyl esterase
MQVLMAVFLTSGGIAHGAPSKCEDLANLKLEYTTITAAVQVPAGTFTPPGGLPLHDLPAFCRVAGVLKPSSDSNIQFEVWMPLSGWRGDLFGVVNGAYAGALNWGGMATTLSSGYATTSTDTGHQGGVLDASWAVGHPEKYIDFAYRALHLTTVTAKEVIHAFYGRGPRYSLYSGCSGGGRLALMEAQRYPADYDGIIAGAAGGNMTHIIAFVTWLGQLTYKNPAGYISTAKLPAIQAAALAECDGNDGVKDGVIENPLQCKFDPSVLLCKGPETDSCLTAPQVEHLKQIYAGAKKANGEQFMPGFSPGGEAASGPAWAGGSATGENGLIHTGSVFFSQMVYDDPSWDYKAFNLERDAKAADDKLGPIVNAADPNLEAFQARGGKLILYHGWSDGILPPKVSINYYESVIKTLGAKKTGSFMRLFMAPGMAHCFGGTGPDVLGQECSCFGTNPYDGIWRSDPDNNIQAALERWVKQGIAPDRLIVRKYNGRKDPASAMVRTRPLCAYPEFAHYKGAGSTDDAANFVCGR